MRTTIGKALLAALRATGEHERDLREHAERWLAGKPSKGFNVPDFKIVMRTDAQGVFWATLAYGSCGYSAADSNALVKVRVAL